MTIVEERRVMARGQAYRRWLTGRRVAVVGLARSGVAACRLLVECGARVVATDDKPLSALGVEARGLEKLGVRLRAGGHPAEAFQGLSERGGRCPLHSGSFRPIKGSKRCAERPSRSAPGER